MYSVPVECDCRLECTWTTPPPLPCSHGGATGIGPPRGGGVPSPRGGRCPVLAAECCGAPAEEALSVIPASLPPHLPRPPGSPPFQPSLAGQHADQLVPQVKLVQLQLEASRKMTKPLMNYVSHLSTSSSVTLAPPAHYC